MKINDLVTIGVRLREPILVKFWLREPTSERVGGVLYKTGGFWKFPANLLAERGGFGYYA